MMISNAQLCRSEAGIDPHFIKNWILKLAKYSAMSDTNTAQLLLKSAWTCLKWGQIDPYFISIHPLN